MSLQTLLSSGPVVLAEVDRLQIVAGLNAVVGDEGAGKTRFLRLLSELESDALWFDLRLSNHDALTPLEFWHHMQSQCPRWSETLRSQLCAALDLNDHLHKQLFMLSAGSRRKVGLLALLVSGAKFVCLDQPFSALDQASISVLVDFLNDMSQDTSRAWLVADYVADPRLDWVSLVELDGPQP
jgi:ABC-type multidrug transport system ATPase subunit